MAEIFRDSVGVGVTFGLPTTSAVVTSATIIRNGTVTPTQTAVVGTETRAQVPYSITRYDGKFDIEFVYTVNGEPYIKRETHEVVTPLFTPQSLREFDPDFVGKPDSEILFLEKSIRDLFETLTGQSFGLEYGTIGFFGNGRQAISLPKRSADSSNLVYSGASQFDITATYEEVVSNEIVNNHAMVTNDGWVLQSYVGESWIDVFEPGRPYSSGFIEGQRYYLTGLWGYYSPPEDIVSAAMLLAQDYGCDQSIWRDRYMKSVRMADMRFEFNGRAFIKTGNVRVDQILDRFTRVRMVVL